MIFGNNNLINNRHVFFSKHKGSQIETPIPKIMRNMEIYQALLTYGDKGIELLNKYPEKKSM